MRSEYPDIEPYDRGRLDVGDGNLVYWEACGDPDGKPAVVLHGGPGSGCTAWHRRMFDPRAYRIILLDQRGCGRSTPHASAHDTDLTGNTTANLIADLELLREKLGVDRWLVWGGSWGCTLALAYAEAHPDRISDLLLWGVTNTRRSELDWLSGRHGDGLARLFPEQWARFSAALPADGSDDLIAGYNRMLNDPDQKVREYAAEEWCRWESAPILPPPPSGLGSRFQDRRFALAFARIVVHYFAHAAWLEEGQLLRDVNRLAGIPGIMVQGRFDVGSPMVTAWQMSRAWHRSELVIVENEGHAPTTPGMVHELIHASDRLASGPG